MQLSQLGDLRKLLNLSEAPLSQQIQKESPGAGTAEANWTARATAPREHTSQLRETDNKQTVATRVARQGHCQQ